MSKALVDVTIHVDEDINPYQQDSLIEVLRDCNGVIGVGHQKKAAHLFIVEYDPEVTSSEELLAKVKQEGVHAELIGL
jgi:hypothetical protein